MNARELQQAIELIYDAWPGPPRAYFEIETPDLPDRPFVRIVYKVYALAIEANATDTGEYESALCQELLRRFSDALTVEEREDRVATLIWRRDARYSRDEVVVFDPADDDYVPTGKVRHMVSLRCYCPRVTSAIVPEGAPYELLEPKFLV